MIISGQGVVTIGWLGTSLIDIAGSVTMTNLDLGGGILGGAGTLTLTGQMTWSGGEMAGGGTTRINGILTVDAPTEVTQTDRLLENHGTVNWDGSQGAGDWTMAGQARIVNHNRFNIRTAPNRTYFLGSRVTALPGIPLDLQARFENQGEVVQTGSSEVTIRLRAVENNGSFQVQGGSLRLATLESVNTGYFDAALSTQVTFELGKITFDPNLEDTSSLMMRGSGWFLVTASGTVDIPQFAVVNADNFELGANGTLDGAGTFEAHRFRWTGGTMQTTGALMGVTRVAATGLMEIDGMELLTLRNREIRNLGLIEWMHTSLDIDFADDGTVVNDGGTFEVWNDNRAILDPEMTAGNLVVRNGGAFNKHLTEYLGTTTIEVRIQNDGGTVNANGSVAFVGGLRHTNASAVSTLGIGNYSGDINITTGTLRLEGGEVVMQGAAALFASGTANLALRGVVSGNLHTSENSVLNVSGNLSVTGRLDLTGNTVANVNGQQLTHTGGDMVVGMGSVLNLGGGTLTVTNRIHNDGTINRQGGTVNVGGRVINMGRINLGAGGGAFEVGELELGAASVLAYEIGGTTQGTDFVQLIVLGHAILAGTIEVTLVNGFVPSANPTPDTFEVLQFGAAEGSFDYGSIDLGGGLFLDLEYGMQDITLVTRD